MATNVVIINADRLVRKLTSLGGDADRVLRKTTERVARFVRDDARLRVPVDTGDLKKSIDYDVTRGAGGYVGKVATSLDYATYVEFGTGIAGQETNQQPGISHSQEWQGQKAQPYMYPALKQNETQIKQAYGNDLSNEIRRISGIG